MSGAAGRSKIRLKYVAHLEMGQSPPSVEHSLSPDDGLPFLQGAAEFGSQCPGPRAYCGSPTKIAVFMTVRLAGSATLFLPFNRGYDGGAGNPSDLAGRTYRTAYLWEEVLQRDSFLDLLARFVHLQIEEKHDDRGCKGKKETMIFSRYHQLQTTWPSAASRRT